MQSRKGFNRDLDTLRVDNCSEIEEAGNGYIQNGTFYYVCCNLANHCFCGGQKECAANWTVYLILVGNWVVKSSISTISDNFRQPPRRIATQNAPTTSVLQERLE